jgi:hypothetical protein
MDVSRLAPGRMLTCYLPCAGVAGSPFSHFWAGVSSPSTPATTPPPVCTVRVSVVYIDRRSFSRHLAASCYILARAHAGLCRCPVPRCCRRTLVQPNVCAQSFALHLKLGARPFSLLPLPFRGPSLSSSSSPSASSSRARSLSLYLTSAVTSPRLVARPQQRP